MGIFDDLVADAELFEAQDLERINEVMQENEEDEEVSTDVFTIELKNLVNREEIPAILKELKGLGTEYLTAPKETTVTLGGYISGVTLMEKTDTDILEPTYQIPHIKSNFGEKTHSSIIPKDSYRKSNRGRKSKEKRVTKSKQGNGTSLNSQISFSKRSMKYGQYHKLTKFKIFRDGRLQVSGAKYERMEEILDMINDLIEYIKTTRIAKDHAYLQRLHATMENYKFSIRLERTESVDLTRLKSAILTKSVDYDWKNGGMNNPISLLYVNYTQTQAMLCIKFDAPEIPKKKKMITVKVSVAGKINILGGLGINYIKSISLFLNAVMEDYHANIIVKNKDCLWSRFSLKEDITWDIPECDYEEYIG